MRPLHEECLIQPGDDRRADSLVNCNVVCPIHDDLGDARPRLGRGQEFVQLAE